ncbi:MAG: VCBS repeat-containing protein [Saprospiraceae bacterium]
MGITLADFNADGWPDIFLSNDFFEKDYLYLNNQNSTFTETSDEFYRPFWGSMGADACDLDNDLRPEIFVTEMLPRSADRKKTKTTYENWDKYQLAVSKGYHHQFGRNVLHKNINGRQFVELGRLAGVESSDWSWSALMQDFDNDGLRDIFISNGIKSDLLDKDYLNYMANETRVRAMIEQDEEVLKKLIDIMPSAPVQNAIYRNEGNLRFSWQSENWGLDTPSFSNGSAYGDLDNDGDLDLVVNNVDQPAFVYRNQSEKQSGANSISVKLSYKSPNTQAIGAKVLVVADTLRSLYEYYPAKGFQSCSAVPVVVGLGNRTMVDSLIVVWPDGSATVQTKLAAGQQYDLRHADGTDLPSYTGYRPAAAAIALREAPIAIDFNHQEIALNHFDRERLLISMPGRKGPAFALADINGDGRDDIFVGGGKNQSSLLYLSGQKGYTPQEWFEDTRRSEVTDAVFFDSDQDGDMDLYVAHGGKAFSIYAAELHDVLYVNEGGKFVPAAQPLPFPAPLSTGSVAVADFNRDGLPDLAIGEAMKTNVYGLPGSCLLLLNRGDNRFEVGDCAAGIDLGMITGVATADINQDGWEDLLVVGEFMPITLLLNESGHFPLPKAGNSTVAQSKGWWNNVEKADLDGDGDMDFVLGNLGSNHFFNNGLTIFVQDFDENGTLEQVACSTKEGMYYPLADIDELYKQMPILKKKYRTYSEFSAAPLEDLVPLPLLQSAVTLQLEEPRTCVLWNNEGVLTLMPLPVEAQYSATHAILVQDADGDGILDILLGGNDYRCQPQFGRQDASFGWICKGQLSPKGVTFARCQPMGIHGQLRSLKRLDERYLLAGINDGKVKIYEW